MKKIVTFCLMLAAGIAMPATAAEVAKVQIPDSVTLAGGSELVLNGAGIRKKFIIKVYVGALYLPAKSTDVAAILAADEPRRISLNMLYDVSAKKLNEAWVDGFNDNTTDAEMAALRSRLDAFEAMFDDAVEGDVIELDYVPGKGTSVTQNGKLAGSVEGADFASVLLRVWLGDKPADKGLKKAMIGE